MWKAQNRRRVCAKLFLALLLVWPVLGRAQNPIDQGLACLATKQNFTGSWGDPNGTAFRDTAVVLDTLDFFKRHDSWF